MHSGASPAKKMPESKPQTPVKKEHKFKDIPGGKKSRLPKFLSKIFSIGMGMDMTFLFLVMLLVIIGIIMMYSASYPYALKYGEGSQEYLESQSRFAFAGVLIMIGVSYVDYQILKKLSWIIYGIGIILLVAVLFMPGDPKRWIYLGSFSFQASEVAKFALVLVLANWSAKHFRKMHTFKVGVFIPALLIIAYLGLMVLEPHYSGIVILGLLGAIMMFIGGVKIRYFVIVGILGGCVVAYFVLTNQIGYAMQRLDGWGQALIYTTKEMWDKTYQTRQSLYAIGSGGAWGLGLGQSRQKYMYIPEPQNDFIFAVVCEELGFMGAAVIMIIFILLVWRGMTIAKKIKDPFGCMLGVGLSAQIGLQAILNVLVITDWLPNTGISLPFFSYGGTALIMQLAEMGIILSISRQSNLEKA